MRSNEAFGPAANLTVVSAVGPRRASSRWLGPGDFALVRARDAAALARLV